MKEDKPCLVYCDRMNKLVPIMVSKRNGIISLCCCHEEGGMDCQHRAELGCALYKRFSAKGNPIVEDLSDVLGQRAQVVRDASKALMADNIPFVIGGRDAVNAYCPRVVKETLRTDFFIRSIDRDAAFRVLRRDDFGIKPLDPTCTVLEKSGVSIELHYGSPPDIPEYVDEETLKRAIKIKLIDVKVALQPIEELVAYKAHRYVERDKVDLARLLDEWGEEINTLYLREVAKKRALSLENLKITELKVGLKSR